MQQQRIPLQAVELAPGTRIVAEHTVLTPELCAPGSKLRVCRPALLGHHQVKGQGEGKHKCTNSSPPSFSFSHGSCLLASEPKGKLGENGIALLGPHWHISIILQLPH